LDERYMKLDAGDAVMLRTVNAGQVPFDTLVETLAQLPQVVIQAMFVKDRMGRVDNSTDLAVTNWITALRRIAPSAIHIYTIDRTPAWPYLQAVPTNRLREIAQRVKMAGLECDIFGAAGKEDLVVSSQTTA
jgi:wyosine [tRNA(Phe)-imidazoG37] synthetase (radical SAM superfamily)